MRAGSIGIVRAAAAIFAHAATAGADRRRSVSKGKVIDDDLGTVIGLEVHAELAKYKAILCLPNRIRAEPNTLVCPRCLGMPVNAASLK